MEEGRSGVGGDGAFHDINPAIHTPEQTQAQVAEIEIFLHDFDDFTALDHQEGNKL